MYCAKCGGKLEISGGFCANCGTKSSESNSRGTSVHHHKRMNTKGAKAWLVLVVVLLIPFAFLTLISFFALFSEEVRNVGLFVTSSVLTGPLVIAIVVLVKRIKKAGDAKPTTQMAGPQIQFETNAKEPTHYDSMSGLEFEWFCAEILKSNGFVDVEVSKGSGDFGIDILAAKDGITYAIQCKRLSNNVGNTAIQEVFSGKEFYRKHIGAVMTNQYFTLSAKETAERTGIVLWDRDKLDEMIVQANKQPNLA